MVLDGFSMFFHGFSTDFWCEKDPTLRYDLDESGELELEEFLRMAWAFCSEMSVVLTIRFEDV